MTARHEDVAAAGQRRLEEMVLALCRGLHARTGLDALCFAGGVALNCVANGLIQSETPFRRLFVQPAAYDGGTGLGAAVLVEAARIGQRPEPLRTVALGPRYTREQIRGAVVAAGLDGEQLADPASDAADRLAAGAVVGWFDGRAELGPRALGHRSILADPRQKDTADRVNRAIKRREPFRPFAPAVLAECASEWFDGPVTPYMTTLAGVRPDRRERIPGVTHIDGTARVQTVDAASEPAFHALIRAFADRTGVPVVLNTSFNLKGEPIVCSPEQALVDLTSANLDAVYLDGMCVLAPGSSDSAGDRRATFR